jgi:hypothetical protein
MSPSEVLSAFLLTIVVLIPLSLMFLVHQNQSQNEKKFLRTLHLLETRRQQTLLNVLMAKDFSVFAGLQNQTGGQFQTPLQNSGFRQGEYVPRDDQTEALRIQQLAQVFGVGETVFTDDEEVNQAVSELLLNGQIDFGGEV